jgi:hypothetical protein
MPAPIVAVGAVIQCPHGGMGQLIPSSPRVLAGGTPVGTLADQYLIAGCAFSPGAPHPCVRIQWVVPAARVMAGGVPVILQSSVGLCQAADQAPQGPAVVSFTQPRVLGT